MESTISYIIIVVIGILTITVYNYKKKQIRIFLLSEQQYPELNLEIKIKKRQGIINAILVRVYAKKDIILSNIKVELISSKREFNHYPLEKLLIQNELPKQLNKNSKVELKIPMDSFKSLLQDGEYPFRTFRFMITSENNKPFKSHEMGFNKKWVIYRPDSGKYN